MRRERFFKRHRTIIITSGIILLIIMIFFGAQIILFLNFIIGNDVVVMLDADKEYFSLKHNQEEKINFQASVITNPFCKAVCRYDFYDISDDVLVDSDEFILNPTNPLKKEYQIKADKPGKGQDLYRFDMECISRNTILCRTGEEPSTRSILVAVDYDLNDEEKLQKEYVKGKLDSLLADIGDIRSRIKALTANANQLNEFLIISEMNKRIFDLENLDFQSKLSELSILWENYDYGSLEGQIANLQKEFDKNIAEVYLLNAELSNIATEYNLTIENVVYSRNKLQDLKKEYSNNKTLKSSLSITINDFNKEIKAFENRTSIEDKKGIAENISIIINKFRIWQKTILGLLKKMWKLVKLKN